MTWNLDQADLTWLQRLARALVVEPHAADDLMQDTLLAASRRPADIVSPRAWLAAIARRLAARRLRDRERRLRREAAAAVPGSRDGDPVELVARAELAERLAGAARSLPEPMRTAVLLRFLEGMDVAAIARRVGKPADTVRYRIRRGLELLRQDVGESEDAAEAQRRCRALLLPLAAPLAKPAAPLTLTLLTIMNAKTFPIAGCALALLIGLTTWALPDDELPAEANEQRVAASTSSPPAAATPAPLATERVALPTATQPEVAAPDRLRGRVVDENGEAVPSAAVLLRPNGEHASPLARTSADQQGEFELDRPSQPAELLVRQNGFCRWFGGVDPNDDELVVVLRRGGELVGRVVDSAGRGVPDLRLLAYAEGASIGHVSPTRSRMYADKQSESPAGSGYEQCFAQTGADGSVRFSGLSVGPVAVRSLDPEWVLEARDEAVKTGEGFVVWTARAGFGVELSVFGPGGREPVPLARGRFHFEVTTPDGKRHDLGEWVGSGVGRVSFGLTDELLPCSLEEAREVVFYGEAGDGEEWAEWRAAPLYEPGKTARVKLVLSGRAGQTPEPVPMATLELDVNGSDGMPWTDQVYVRWRDPMDPELTGGSPVAENAQGRHVLEVPAGRIQLEVQQRFASGSIGPWRGEVVSTEGGLATAIVTLPKGATAVLTRPENFVGGWKVRAQLRQSEDEEWFGAWTYGTEADELVLNALKPAQWRFELFQGDGMVPAQGQSSVVRHVTLADGDRRTVDR